MRDSEEGRTDAGARDTTPDPEVAAFADWFVGWWLRRGQRLIEAAETTIRTQRANHRERCGPGAEGGRSVDLHLMASKSGESPKLGAAERGDTGCRDLWFPQDLWNLHQTAAGVGALPRRGARATVRVPRAPTRRRRGGAAGGGRGGNRQNSHVACCDRGCARARIPSRHVGGSRRSRPACRS
jgi:hypothetical protein